MRIVYAGFLQVPPEEVEQQVCLPAPSDAGDCHSHSTDALEIPFQIASAFPQLKGL